MKDSRWVPPQRPGSWGHVFHCAQLTQAKLPSGVWCRVPQGLPAEDRCAGTLVRLPASIASDPSPVRPNKFITLSIIGSQYPTFYHDRILVLFNQDSQVQVTESLFHLISKLQSSKVD